MLLQLLSKVTG